MVHIVPNLKLIILIIFILQCAAALTSGFFAPGYIFEIFVIGLFTKKSSNTVKMYFATLNVNRVYSIKEKLASIFYSNLPLFTLPA